MSLQIQLSTDLIAAMKAGETAKVSTLRMLQAALKNEEIKSKSELAEPQVAAIIKKQIEQLKDSISFAEKVGRTDTAIADQAAVDQLQQYLPAELSDTELEIIVSDVLADTDNRDFGPLMGQVMKAVAGRAGGDRVTVILRAKLAV